MPRSVDNQTTLPPTTNHPEVYCPIGTDGSNCTSSCPTKRHITITPSLSLQGEKKIYTFETCVRDHDSKKASFFKSSEMNTINTILKDTVTERSSMGPLSNKQELYGMRKVVDQVTIDESGTPDWGYGDIFTNASDNQAERILAHNKETHVQKSQDRQGTETLQAGSDLWMKAYLNVRSEMDKEALGDQYRPYPGPVASGKGDQ